MQTQEGVSGSDLGRERRSGKGRGSGKKGGKGKRKWWGGTGKKGWLERRGKGGEGRGVKGNYREGKVLVGGDSEQKKIKKRNRKGKWFAAVSVVVAAISLLVSLLLQITWSS